jgi:hypothetical protein
VAARLFRLDPARLTIARPDTDEFGKPSAWKALQACLILMECGD